MRYPASALVSMLVVVVLLFPASLSGQATSNVRKCADTEGVLRILNAPDATKLARAFRESNHGFCATAARTYRANTLRLPGAETELFKALPLSAVQMRQLYELTTLSVEEGKEQFVAFYEGFYKTAYAAAPKHPSYFPTLFQIARNFGQPGPVTEGEWFCDLLHDSYEKHPDVYLRSLIHARMYRGVALNCAAACGVSKE